MTVLENVMCGRYRPCSSRHSGESRRVCRAVPRGGSGDTPRRVGCARLRRACAGPRTCRRRRCRSATSGWSRSPARSRWRRTLLLMDEPASGLNDTETERLGRTGAAHRRARRHGAAGRARHAARHGSRRPGRGDASWRKNRRRRRADAIRADPAVIDSLSRAREDMSTLLELERVDSGYGAAPVLHEVSLDRRRPARSWR